MGFCPCCGKFDITEQRFYCFVNHNIRSRKVSRIEVPFSFSIVKTMIQTQRLFSPKNHTLNQIPISSIFIFSTFTKLWRCQRLDVAGTLKIATI
mmetsp:Transcript_21775/g.45762  ORF Transcript_21775/g.45762 Transcript_21775/m.45762 type:complete len:94 (+) Transcript_21775:174-455(+)